MRCEEIPRREGVCMAEYLRYGSLWLWRFLRCGEIPRHEDVCMTEYLCYGNSWLRRFLRTGEIPCRGNISMTEYLRYGSFCLRRLLHCGRFPRRGSGAIRSHPTVGIRRRAVGGIPIYSCGKSRFLLTGRPVSCIITLLYITVIWRMEWKKNHRIL